MKGKQLKKTAKFRAWRRPGFEDTKRIVWPETRPIIFGTFEKRVPVIHYLFGKYKHTGSQREMMACTYSLSYNGVQGLFSKKTPIPLYLSCWLGSMTRYVHDHLGLPHAVLFGKSGSPLPLWLYFGWASVLLNLAQQFFFLLVLQFHTFPTSLIVTNNNYWLLWIIIKEIMDHWIMQFKTFYWLSHYGLWANIP